MLWLFVPQFQRIINESPFFLIFSKSQNHNSLTPCGRWWWFEDPEPKSLCRLHLWDRSSINQAKHEIMLDCVIAFLIVQCSKNGENKFKKKELLDNYSAIWFSLGIIPLPIHKQEHLQITALFADFIVPNLVICCWSKSLQEWGTHNFSSSFWQKKNLKEFQFCAHFFCAIIIYLRIICSFFLFYFFRFFFLSTFFFPAEIQERDK